MDSSKAKNRAPRGGKKNAIKTAIQTFLVFFKGRKDIALITALHIQVIFVSFNTPTGLTLPRVFALADTNSL